MSHSILCLTIIHLNIAKCACEVQYFLSIVTMNLTQVSIVDIEGIWFKIDLDSEQYYSRYGVGFSLFARF